MAVVYNETLLQEYNFGKIREYAPEMAFIVAFSTLGILGNLLASIYYVLRKNENTTMFALASLSVNDLMASIIVLPDVVIAICFTVTFRSIFLCKLSYFLNRVIFGNSILLLLFLGMDRYFRVCRKDFKTILTFRIETRILIGLIIFSVCTSARDIVFADVETVNVTIDVNTTVVGYQCMLSTEIRLLTAETVFHIFDVVTISIIVMIIIVLYSLIIRTVSKSRKRLHSMSAVVRPSVLSAQLTQKTCIKSGSKPSKLNQLTTSVLENNKSTPYGSSTLCRQRTKKILERQLTVMILLMTTITLLSFVPYFVIGIGFEPASFESPLWVRLLYRSYILHVSVNPYIIGCFNVEFRNFITSIFKTTHSVCCSSKGHVEEKPTFHDPELKSGSLSNELTCDTVDI